MGDTVNFKQNPLLAWGERRLGLNAHGDHLIATAVEQLLAVGRPGGFSPSIGRDQDLASRAIRVRPHIDLIVPRRVRRVSDPAAVRGKDRRAFARRCDQKRNRNIAEVLWAEAGEEAIGEFVRRLVFSVLIGNADMHLKNWSLIYPDRRKVTLSPGYDFVLTITYIAEDRDMALNLYGPGTKAMSEVSLERLTKLAAKALLPERVVLDAASETVARFNAVWPHAGDLGPLPASIKEAIDAHLGAVPVVSEVLGARATSASTTA